MINKNRDQPACLRVGSLTYYEGTSETKIVQVKQSFTTIFAQEGINLKKVYDHINVKELKIIPESNFKCTKRTYKIDI